VLKYAMLLLVLAWPAAAQNQSSFAQCRMNIALHS
jgi:hypothetical protein